MIDEMIFVLMLYTSTWVGDVKAVNYHIASLVPLTERECVMMAEASADDLRCFPIDHPIVMQMLPELEEKWKDYAEGSVPTPDGD